jgi:hypothetical protein
MLKKTCFLNIIIAICSFFIILCSCQSLPELFSSVEKIADDNAIKIEVSHEALQQNTDLQITVDVKNKDIK